MSRAHGSWTRRTRRAYASVTNIGYRPTVNGRSRRLESHLLDFPAPGESGDLYGQRLVVEFLQRLRGEQRFDGPQQLVEQIHADIAGRSSNCSNHTLPAGERTLLHRLRSANEQPAAVDATPQPAHGPAISPARPHLTV